MKQDYYVEMKGRTFIFPYGAVFHNNAIAYENKLHHMLIRLEKQLSLMLNVSPILYANYNVFLHSVACSKHKKGNKLTLYENSHRNLIRLQPLQNHTAPHRTTTDI